MLSSHELSCPVCMALKEEFSSLNKMADLRPTEIAGRHPLLVVTRIEAYPTVPRLGAHRVQFDSGTVRTRGACCKYIGALG